MELKMIQNGTESITSVRRSIFERFIQLGKHVKTAINISITGAFG